MLLNRHWKAIFMCLLITKLSEQSLGGQGQPKKNPSQQQQRQLQHGVGGPPAQRLDDELKAVLQHKARDMRRHMNLNQEPCKDFYEYVCGNWMLSQNVSDAKDGDTISVTDQLERQVNVQLQDLLNGPKTSTADTTAVDDTVAKEFYRSCTQAAASSADQKEYIKKFVEYHGGLPYVKDSQWQEKRYSWIDVVAQLKHRFNLDILISLTIPKYSVGRAVPIPILEEPQQTILSAQLCSFLAAQHNEEKDEVFNSIQMEIKDNLRSWLDLGDSDATRLAGDIQRFEFELCKNMRKREWLDIPNGNGSQSRSNYKPITPNKLHGVLQNPSNGPQQLHELESEYKIEFIRFVQISLGKGHSRPREFYFRDKEYFQHLSTIASKGLTPSFAYYIMYRALTEITIPLNQPRAERPFYCVRKALQFFPDTLGSLYQTKYRRDIVLSDLRDMLKNIGEAFADSVDVNAFWLQKSLRSDIKLRARSWKLKEPEYQGGNDATSDLHLDAGSNYWKSLDIVMEHSSQRNLQQLSSYSTSIKHHVEEFVTTFPTNTETRLHLSWGLLQPPLYAYNYPRSLKYSTLGYIMAREMVKHYDQQGWQDNPAPLVNAWDMDSMEGFIKIKECFRIQTSNYLFNKPNIFRNGTQLREIVVDTSAVNIAFSAYIKWLQEQDANNAELQYETLPDMNFSNTQLFFIHHGQSRCAARYTAQSVAAPAFFPLARHTPERLTINGPLSNGYEMGRDFNCPIGSAMNVADKCLIF